MKHLQSYKENKLKYNVGDYVKIKIIPDYVMNIDKIKDNLFVKIIELSDAEYINSSTIRDYHLTFETLITNQEIYGNQYFIDRKMTKKEIEYCKQKKDERKYNL